MHISEGVLAAPVLAGGAALGVAGLALGLKKLDFERLPLAALLSAVFFVASLIHLPLGPASVHLVLNGLVGLLLGWAAFPAIFVALTLQAILFQYGGLTGLGVNTLSMALPAVICYYAFGPWMRRGGKAALLAAAFGAGFFSVLLAGLITALSLYFSGEEFFAAAWAILAASLPVMVLEGIVTSVAVWFLKMVRPASLGAGQV
jgi:cobalt/nickel transport system permease protein